ncbi:DNA internalization-related competence protein ComEC/Rec2 [Pseudaeromonas paramecii]|uniref:DNA internalization-related competence protein ComEC/Rec2 n=2 Tax=Pseudaeromonas paramecii TaxID=2138166 RepID=A0ABP8QG81_9GAMM
MAATLSGVGWMVLFFNLQLAWLGQLYQGETQHTISGTVLESRVEGQTGQLIVALSQLDAKPLWPVPRIRLGLYPPPAAFTPGDSLSARVRLVPIQGLGNPVGFDALRQALGQGITARGSLKQLLSHAPAPPDLRQRLLSRARAALGEAPTAGLVLALVFGERDGVEPGQWQQLRQVGLIHLMAISGLHIGLACGLGYLLARLPLWLGAGYSPRLPWLGGGLLALGYAYLADFALPTQRALLMLCLWIGGHLLRRRWGRWQLWWLTLVGLLCLDGWALFSTGFWLSIGAVGLIFVLLFVWPKAGLFRLQLGLGVGLLPLQWSYFGGLSWLALPVNLLAVPLFCLCLIPLALLSTLLLPLFPELAGLGLQSVAWLLWALMQLIDGLTERLNGWLWLSQFQGIAACLLLAAWLVWRWPAGRPLALCGLLAVCLLWAQPRPPWQLTLVDVGQGLSVLVRQGDEGLLYDAGDAFPGGFNLAEAAVLPMLRWQGIRRLHALVVSHADRDHSANWQRILAALPVQQLISSHRWTADTQVCQRGQRWRWGSLTLEVLAPWQARDGQHNEDSCVVRISDGRQAVLLTGDLTAGVERRLVAAGQPRADILVSPHHGSRYSSIPDWIAAVDPALVLHSAGQGNRWGFPHAEVRARYGGRAQWVTGEAGALSLAFWPEGWQLAAYRATAPWYQRRPLGSQWLPLGCVAPCR